MFKTESVDEESNPLENTSLETGETCNFNFKDDEYYEDANYDDYDDYVDYADDGWYACGKTRNVKNTRTKCRSQVKIKSKLKRKLKQQLNDEKKESYNKNKETFERYIKQLQRNDREIWNWNRRRSGQHQLRKDFSRTQKLLEQFEAQKTNIDKRLRKHNIKRHKELQGAHFGYFISNKNTKKNKFELDSTNKRNLGIRNDSEIELLMQLQYRDVTPEDYELLLVLDESLQPKRTDSTTLDSLLKHTHDIGSAIDDSVDQQQSLAGLQYRDVTPEDLLTLEEFDTNPTTNSEIIESLPSLTKGKSFSWQRTLEVINAIPKLIFIQPPCRCHALLLSLKGAFCVTKVFLRQNHWASSSRVVLKKF